MLCKPGFRFRNLRIYADNRPNPWSTGAWVPALSAIYVPSDDQKDHAITIVILGMSATSLVAYILAKWSENTVLIAEYRFYESPEGPLLQDKKLVITR